MRRHAFTLLCSVFLLAFAVCAGPLEDELLIAVRKSDVAGVKAALAKGANVNFKFRYDRNALSFACDRGNVEVAKLLIDAGADVNNKDTFYGVTPVAIASGGLGKGNSEILKLLLQKGANGKEQALIGGAAQGDLDTVKVVLEVGGLKPENLNNALAAAKRSKKPEVVDVLVKAGAVEPPKPNFQVAPDILQKYAGTYKNDSGFEVTLSVKDGGLAAVQGGQGFTLSASDKSTFSINEFPGITVIFNWEGEKVVSLTVKQGGTDTIAKKVEGK